jgi:glucose/mannose-6-phosphate isomerase
MLKLINNLPQQITDALQLAQTVPLPPLQPGRREILIAAMGGSAISADLLQGLLWHTSPTRITTIKDYQLPYFASGDIPENGAPPPLFIAISYSGNTEETLSAYQQAVRRKLPRIVITSGGRLRALAHRNHDPVLPVPPGYPPRAALPSLLTPLLTTLSAYQLIPDLRPALRRTAALLTRLRPRYQTQARTLARALKHRLPVIYSTSPLLDPVANRWRCQLNENAKTFSHSNTFPELDHNEIVGYSRPAQLPSLARIIVLMDPAVHPRTRHRVRLTLQILRRQNAGAHILTPAGSNPLAQVFSFIMLGDLVSYYLARAYGIDPVPVKPIEELKRHMARVP